MKPFFNFTWKISPAQAFPCEFYETFELFNRAPVNGYFEKIQPAHHKYHYDSPLCILLRGTSNDIMKAFKDLNSLE